MKEAVVAKVYAKALLEMAAEKKLNLVEELTKLTEVINKSNLLENVLFLDVFTQDEKKSVFHDVASRLSLSPFLIESVNFLIEEKRIGFLPLIFKEATVLDDERRGFMKGTVEGAEDTAAPGLIEQMKAFLKDKLGREPQLNYVHNANLSAGYRITVDDLQLDATLDHQLAQFKKNIISE